VSIESTGEVDCRAQKVYNTSMQRKASFFPIFLVFIILAILIFFFSQKGLFAGLTGFFEQATVPLQKMTFGVFHTQGNQTSEEKLRAENSNLLTQLAKQKGLEKENRALHDQFEATNPDPKKLLPATIIGMHDDEITIDKGTSDGVKAGNVIVYKDNLIGRIVTVSGHLSVVHLLTNKSTSFTAETAKTSALGVIKGQGAEGILFDTVVLSDKLEKEDLVVTKGDIDASGLGFPPGIIVGKIISVNKKASSLFQTAEVQSLVDFSQLTVVFVLSELY